MASIASAKLPVVYPKVWVGKSSVVPDEIRKNGVPFRMDALIPAAARCPLRSQRCPLRQQYAR